MADGPNSANLVFGADCERCPVTGRHYEQGSGALSHEAQTANYIREAGIAADMPKHGEVCPQTGRAYETGSGCGSKTWQTKQFLAELPPEQQAQRKAAAQALHDAEPAGQA
jgi:hypothetical protein